MEVGGLRLSPYEDLGVTPATVLHVLPHPGGGGETYVDSLAQMTGYDHSRFFLAASRTPLAAAPSLASSVPRANLHARRADIVHVHGEVAGSLCLPALARTSSLLTLHGLNLARRASGLVHRAAKLNLWLIVRTATRTICVSEEEREDVIDLVGDRLASRIIVIPNGVALPALVSAEERQAIRAELGVDEQLVVLSVGALDPPKDPLTPADAVSALAREGLPVVLLVVGDGTLRGRAEDIASGSGGAVQVLGQRDDVPRLLTAADIFVLSSKHEGLPYSLLEAMAGGLPSVASNFPGALEVVGDAGAVVTRDDVDAFRRELGRLAADPTLRATLGERARNLVESRFSLEHMLEATRQVYEEVG